MTDANPDYAEKSASVPQIEQRTPVVVYPDTVTRVRARLDRNRCAYLSGPYRRGYAGKGTTGSEEYMARCLLDRAHGDKGHLIETEDGRRSRVWPDPE